MANLKARADELEPQQWTRLERPAKYKMATEPRQRPDNVKQQVVRERGFENIRLQGEDVAAFAYRPGACDRDYRVVVVRKNLSVAKGEQVLFDDIRYFFYITNQTDPADQIVIRANQRCNQENLIEQLKNGVRALQMPVGDQTSNWAYMVIASLAWTLKAWFALLLPETGRWGPEVSGPEADRAAHGVQGVSQRLHVRAVSARTHWAAILFRVLAWNRWLPVLFRAVDVLRQPLRC